MITEEMKTTLNKLGIPVQYTIVREVTKADVGWLTRYFRWLGYSVDVNTLIGTNIYY